MNKVLTFFSWSQYHTYSWIKMETIPPLLYHTTKKFHEINMKWCFINTTAGIKESCLSADDSLISYSTVFILYFFGSKHTKMHFILL